MKRFFYLFLVLVFATFTAIAENTNTYEIPSDDFPDLLSAVEFINTHAPAGDTLFFAIQGDTELTEPQLTITASGTSEAPVYITWDGQGAKPIVNFSGTSADEEAGIHLNGASYITIDGLDIRNPDGELEYGIYLTNSDGVTGAQHNTVKNTHITLNKENTNITNGIRIFALHERTDNSGSNSNNRFINNHISNVLFAYLFDSDSGEVEYMDSGNQVASKGEGTHIIEDIVMCGVYLLDQNGATVSGVNILNLNRPDDGTPTAPAAISTTGSFPSGPLTHPFEISGNKIEAHYAESTTIFGMFLNQRNVHYNIHSNTLNDITTGGSGNIYASGIFLFASGSTAYIYNNMLSGIAASHSSLTTAAATRGLDVRSYEDVGIYFNSVYLQYMANNNGHRSGALNIHNTSDPVDLRNNILVNKTQPGMGVSGNFAAIHKNTGSVDNIAETSDNNIYYAGTPGPNNFIFFGGSTDHADQTLEDFQVRAENFDQNSFTEDVPFLGANNLYVDPMAETQVRNNAQPITSPLEITTDIDGMLRDPENPDIGADELSNPYPDLAGSPLPEDGQTNVSIDLEKLQWQYIETPYYINPDEFVVYFSTEPEFSSQDVIAHIPYQENEENYSWPIDPNVIEWDYQTTYYWKVVPAVTQIRKKEAEEAITWSFTTEAFVHEYPNTAQQPQPADGEENVQLSLTALTWQFHQEESYTEPAGFWIYLGTEANLDEVPPQWVDYDSDETIFEYPLNETDLEPITTYFWKVVPTVDPDDGPDAEGVEVWSFTMEEEVSVNNFDDSSLNIYPNPTSGILNLHLVEKSKVQIINMEGRIIWENQVNDLHKQLNLSDWQPGIYILRVTGDKNRTHRKFELMD